MEKVKGFLFSIILVFGIVCSRTVPSFAFAYTIDPSMIGSAGDFAYALLGGAKFDFTGSKYVIDGYDSMTAQEKYDARIGKMNDFLQDYYLARASYIYSNNGMIQQVNGIYDRYSLAEAGLIQDVASNYMYSISPQAIADWTRYTKSWIYQYQNSLTSDPEIVQPTPDITYESLLNTINGTGFWFKDYPSQYVYANMYKFVFVLPINNYSWCQRGTRDNDYVFSGSNDRCVSIPIQTINITSNNGLYSFSQTIASTTSVYRYSGSGYNNLNGQYCQVQFYNSGTYSGGYMCDQPATYNLTFSKSGSLTDVLTYISKKFRNVNIYVDNVLWAVAGNPQVLNPVIPDFPDVIGTDEDPIYTFDVPDTSNYEGAFDITSIFDLIADAIAGASDTDNTTSGVLTGENVSDLVVDDEGTDVGTKAIPIADILDQSIEGEATKRLPNIELYPDQIHNAFSGTTLLADIVLATQESLPAQIILVFWGIVIVLFIIALVKSLHR